MAFDANLVFDNLWLGSEDAAHSSVEILKQHNISHILTVGFGLSMPFQNDFVCFQVPSIDLPVYNISKDLNKSILFITKAMNEGTGILVHCARGVSRSASMVIGYILSFLCSVFAESF